MRKLFSILLSLMILFSSMSLSSMTVFAESDIEIDSNYALLMDYETGDILYEKNGYEKVYPASTTKIWTAYLVLKYVEDLNETIEIKDFEPVEGSSMYLKNGERFTVKQLLDAVLIQSANDACVVLAQHVSGSVEKFCELMNKEAANLGAKNTRFINPHGLPDENHYTTPFDMTLMAREAMNNETFRTIVKTKVVRYDSNAYSEISRVFDNSNLFLQKTSPYYYDIVDGIKTGTTEAAGKCLVSSAVKDNRRVIASVFKADGDNLYPDSKTLLDYGLDNFTSHILLNKEEYVKTKSVSFSKERNLIYKPKYNYKVVLDKGKNPDEYTFKEVLTDISMPIKKGDTVGHLEVYDGDTQLTKVSLVAENDVTSILGFITFLGDMTLLKTIITLLIMLFILIIIVGFIIRNYIIIQRKKRNRYNKNIFSSKKKKSFLRRR